MKKNFAQLFLYLTLFTIFGFSASPRANGQSSISVRPTALYRFEVSYWDGGHLLTGIYQEGLANGYSFDPFNYPRFDGLGIYVPPPGYTPDPSVGLVPLHRWTVIQDGWRTHYYYSTYYTQQPPDRFYNGIAGYVFPPGQTLFNRPGLPQPLGLHQLSVWYSQDLGFWNGYGAFGYFTYVEPPPERSGRDPYGYQGIICALPPAETDQQYPESVPVVGVATGVYDVTFLPPSGGGGGGGGGNTGDCNPSSGTVNACHHNGGEWDYVSCSCQY